jgi:predicted phage gp36 major capsid-like protein
MHEPNVPPAFNPRSSYFAELTRAIVVRSSASVRIICRNASSSVEAEDMPDIAANSLSIAFGDFRRGYLVVDRAGVRVLRDPYSAKPYVLFYTTKRVGGGVQDYDAIKLLKFA